MIAIFQSHFQTTTGYFPSCRRSNIVESIAADFQRGVEYSDTYNDSDSEEGAKLLKLLEKASEPEVLLAGMSPDQINSFTKYQAKLEVNSHALPYWNASM